MGFFRMPSILLLVGLEFGPCRSRPQNVAFIAIGAERFFATLPVIESALTVISAQYNETLSVKLDIIFPPTSACDVFADNIVNYATKFYYDSERTTMDDRVKIFFGPSCTVEVMTLAPIMTSLNVLYASFLGAAPAISDKQRYPTTITVSPNLPTVLIQGFRTLLRTFRWTNLFMICQDNIDEPVPFFRMICTNFRVPRQLGAVQVLAVDVTFNAERKIDFAGVLKQAANAARVILFLATSEIIRLFMIHAKRHNMTTGEYVYLCAMPYLNSYEFQDLRWKTGDVYDAEAKEAFRQLFFVIYDNSRAVDKLSNETKQFIIQRSAAAYNYTYAANELIPAPTIAAYETSLVLAEALNESVSTGRQEIHDAKLFARRFFNKTFHLPTGDIYMNGNGDRIPDLLIRQLNPDSGQIEPVMFYTGATQVIRNMPELSPRWINGAAPLGYPLCGYDGLDPVCFKRLNLLLNAPLPAGLILLFFMVIAYFARRYYDSVFNDRWWIVQTNIFAARAISKKVN